MSVEDIQVSKSLKRSAVGSFAVSVVVHALIAIVMVFIVAMVYEEKPELEFVADPPQRPRLEPRKLEMKVRANQLQRRSARPQLAPRLAAMTPSRIALPEIKNPNQSRTAISRNASNLGNVGRGSGIGGGVGDGLGGGGGGAGLPLVMRDRCDPQTRLARLAKGGGDVRVEAAVGKGLDYLAKTQNSDGSWGQQYKVGMTGLALLAFLGHCETPDSPRYGIQVVSALQYLIEVNRAGQGVMHTPGFHHWAYEHAIATYALSEAYSLLKNPVLAELLAPSVQKIVYGQSADGGWRYELDKKDSDVSVTAWCVMALKAAHTTGLSLPGVTEALDNAARYIQAHVRDDGAVYYSGRGFVREGSLDGAGALCILWWPKGGSNILGSIMKRISSRADRFDWNGPDANLYSMFYETYASYHRKGIAWTRWNRAFHLNVVGAQLPDGSWPPTGGQPGNGPLNWQGGGGNRDALTYRTALAVLMLEVYYRFLPSGH